MSFISVLRHIGSVVLGVEHIAEPIVEALFPASTPLFAIFDRMAANIATIESQMPTASGTAKSAAVATAFDQDLQMVQAILQQTSQQLVYDPAAWQAANDAQVAAYNAYAALKATFKVLPMHSTTSILDVAKPTG